MNIFFLSRNPVVCARYHADSHVRKMILETAQMLCTSWWEIGHSAPYKPTHRNHPCTVWVGQSASHFCWTLELGFELCREFEHRFGKKHATLKVLNELESRGIPVESRGWTDPPQCMPNEYRRKHTVDAYRAYYLAEKKHLANWTNRGAPSWWERA